MLFHRLPPTQLYIIWSHFIFDASSAYVYICYYFFETNANLRFNWTGYCDGSASIVNGSGLNDSVAGEIAQFSVYLIDIYQYPAFVELGSIKVQIVRENDSYNVQPSISPIIHGICYL